MLFFIMLTYNRRAKKSSKFAFTTANIILLAKNIRDAFFLNDGLLNYLLVCIKLIFDTAIIEIVKFGMRIIHSSVVFTTAKNLGNHFCFIAVCLLH
jgi:hypothetical protein